MTAINLPFRIQSPTPSKKSYDSYRWARDSYSRQGRLVDIWRFTLMLVYYNWLDKKNWSYGSTEAPTEAQLARRRRQRAIWIRETILELGPTFIKAGQMFSTRADLFSAEYIEELSALQDRVPAFDFERAADIVEGELGRSLTEIYSYFDPTPIAAASLGQVHRAQLHTGEEIVVKVQRPGLRRLFEIDLDILRGIAEFFQYRTKWGRGGRDWVGIYEECRRTLWEEVDYLNEGRNADTFRRNFRAVENVAVPRVYWRYSSPQVLTLEYLPGIKISDFEALTAAGLDRSAVARLGAEAYLRQVLQHGFFHADPHPGNLAVKPDGTLIFYDFGMMGEVQLDIKAKLMVTLQGIATRDASVVVDSMVELGALVPSTDMSPVRRSVQYMLDNFLDRPMGQHGSISIAEISEDLYELAQGQPFRFPATFTFVMRAFSTLEGLGKALDPEFNFMEVAQPFTTELMAQTSPNETNTLIDQLGRQAAQFTNTSLSLPRRIEQTLDKLEQGDIRVRVRSVETDRLLRQLQAVGLGAIFALLFAAFLIVTVQLAIAGLARLALILSVFAAGAAIATIRSLLQLKRFDRF
ncbi:AarF/ABC1/UbiB kinase family protein [Synechococcus sp. PCC 7336]|uniref:ABC1 kinase family protein n=1 Tax=Synechococcus sp. PCC 7336 TaxID=195250 RepID=UPI000347C0AD